MQKVFVYGSQPEAPSIIDSGLWYGEALNMHVVERGGGGGGVLYYAGNAHPSHQIVDVMSNNNAHIHKGIYQPRILNAIGN